MAAGKTLWHIFKEIIVYTHVGAAVLSGVGLVVTAFGGLDQSWRKGLVIGFAYCLFVLFVTFAFWLWAAWRREYRERLRQWWKYRRFTNAGLDWRVFGHDLVRDHGVAILRVRSISELPQPLDLLVTCLGGIEHFYARFYPDPARPTEPDNDADIEMWDADRQKVLFLTLRSPKLHPPGYLDIPLTSVGNGKIQVLTVRRNSE